MLNWDAELIKQKNQLAFQRGTNKPVLYFREGKKDSAILEIIFIAHNGGFG